LYQVKEWLRKRVRGVLLALRLRRALAGNPTARMLHAFLLSLSVWQGDLELSCCRFILFHPWDWVARHRYFGNCVWTNQRFPVLVQTS